MQRSIQTRKLYSKGMPRHSVKGNSIPKLILRRSKPSFQPSIPNIHLTSKHKPETGGVHCSPLRLGLSPLAERLLRLSIITEGSNAPHKMLPNCGCACIKRTPPSQKFTCQANMTCAIHMTSQNLFFFLHCRTSARLGRSTTGVSL